LAIVQFGGEATNEPAREDARPTKKTNCVTAEFSGFLTKAEKNQSKIFQKSACEIFHDEANFQFSNPQLVWLIEQLVSSEVIFYIEVIQQNLFSLRIFRRDVHGEFECAAVFATGGKFYRAGI
jgi:hypothetical protein